MASVQPSNGDSIAASYGIMAVVCMVVALVLILNLHLLPALFAGLLVYELVHILAPRIFGLRDQPGRAKIVAVALLATAVVIGISALIALAIAFFGSEGGSLAVLLQKMAEIIESSRATLPKWAQEWLPPADAEALKEGMVEWLREHAQELKAIGGETGRAVAHALVGMIIGSLIALREVQTVREPGPLARALLGHAASLGEAFRRIVFAQVRISGLNAVLTGIYLAVVLPLFGVNLPLTKTMIMVTFIVGLLPVIGNLISNTVIVIISLSHSLPAAAASLVFLVVIHKLEYFVNARIIGSQIQAAAWELLLAMLVMEAAFGIPGVIAAPVFYAYAKAELTGRGLI